MCSLIECVLLYEFSLALVFRLDDLMLRLGAFSLVTTDPCAARRLVSNRSLDAHIYVCMYENYVCM